MVSPGEISIPKCKRRVRLRIKIDHPHATSPLPPARRPMLTAVVVFPTPPFWFMIAIEPHVTPP